MVDALQRFREYMARFDPVASPLSTVTEGYYVARPGRSVAQTIATRVKLAPTNAHLVVGSIGSGKTTEILNARNLIAETNDIWTRAIDVSRYHDIDQMEAGVLTVLAGYSLSKKRNYSKVPDASRERYSELTKRFIQAAEGHSTWVYRYDRDEYEYEPDSDDESGVWVHRAGVLKPTQPDVRSDVAAHAKALRDLVDIIKPVSGHFVLIFDSLDRISDPIAFENVVVQDVRAIRNAGLGVILVGPLRSLYGKNRSVLDVFDQNYLLASVDVSPNTKGREFLVDVLRKRANADILPDRSCAALVRASGGVLRDLISLARSSGEEAYLAGSTTVEPKHVKAAASAFGRALMQGLDLEDLEILERARAKGHYVSTSDKHLALLSSRRILEYRDDNNAPSYSVHPTIASFLKQIARDTE